MDDFSEGIALWAKKILHGFNAGFFFKIGFKSGYLPEA